ncbi:hypothetical protein HOY34_11250 [Xinfangfangia sp. D13-10-4-6]|uniref:hypothetical protein n=1 Tax=Pseudogemmobacter hezensis TaxID=2737662 RepID=UPI001554F3A3|nr:hypothetical protein [Pseudogemmobacter hezensis]NPD15778.1 hypothetical protein [Pseudogemmobacter hezensis]
MRDATFSGDAVMNMRQCIALVAMSATVLRQIGGSQRSQAEALGHLCEVMALATALG